MDGERSRGTVREGEMKMVVITMLSMIVHTTTARTRRHRLRDTTSIKSNQTNITMDCKTLVVQYFLRKKHI